MTHTRQATALLCNVTHACMYDTIVAGASPLSEHCCKQCESAVGQDFSKTNDKEGARVQGKRKSELLDRVLGMFPPRMHTWLLSKWSEPAAWHSARLAFTRTAAVWSMVRAPCAPRALVARQLGGCSSWCSQRHMTCVV